MPPMSRGIFASFLPLRCRPLYILVRGLSTAMQDLKPYNSVRPLTEVRLREYQEECIQSVLSYLAKGHKRLGVSLATGSGKTVIFTQLIDRVKPSSKEADQTLILAHRQELVAQAATHCTNAYPTKNIEIEMGPMHASGAADITIASIQSLISGDRMAKYEPKRFKLVLVDEAHHIVAPSYMRALSHFGLSDVQPNSPALVGVSATLSRFDGLRLGAALDHIVYHKDYIDMIGEKWLSDVIFTTVESKADISKVKRGATGDFQAAELSRAVNTEQINKITVSSWLVKAKHRKSTLVFCVDLAHVADLTMAFRAHGVDARFVTGDTPRIERSRMLDSFRAGEFPVLLNCGIFTEGTDVPNIDCVLLTRPTKSRNLLVQMIGRGMRLYPGKVNCHIIDMVANLTTGIVTTPTLFGLDPSEVVENTNVDDMQSLQELRKEQELQRQQIASSTPTSDSQSLVNAPRDITFKDYDSVFDLIQDTSGERHIRVLSMNNWVEVAEDCFILGSPTGSFLRIEKKANNESEKTIYLVRETVSTRPVRARSIREGISPFRTPREITRSEMFEDALHAADNYASKKYAARFIRRNLAWRNGPATNGQLDFLNKLRPRDDLLTAEMITKGKAGDMITKIKHGARGRFARVEIEKRREEKAKLKAAQDQALREREQVGVGPLLL